MDSRILGSWTEELATTATEIDAQRAGYVARLRPVFMELADSLLGFSVELEYLRGWSSERALEMVLAGSEIRDRRLKTTTVGPHRADLTFKIDGAAARDRVSRGQQKMLAVALIIGVLSLAALTGLPTRLKTHVTLFAHEGRYRAMIDDIRRAPDTWQETHPDERVLVDNTGQSLRVAFKLGNGLIDDFGSIVYDPSGVVALESSRENEEVFGGVLSTVRHLRGPWYYGVLYPD
jgi:hypothetical protein